MPIFFARVDRAGNSAKRHSAMKIQLRQVWCCVSPVESKRSVFLRGRVRLRGLSRFDEPGVIPGHRHLMPKVEGIKRLPKS